MLHQQMRSARVHMRQSDIAESRQLLWELMSYEPTVCQCLRIVESTCLGEGVRCFIDNRECSEAFQRFVDEHYVGFCRRAIQCFFAYGFVPWYVRKDVHGNSLPDVLPHGTFEWGTQPATEEDEPGSRRKPLLVYRVEPQRVNLKPADVHVYEYAQPSLNVSTGSYLNATVCTPMSQVLAEFKELRQAQIRCAYADAWNTTAKLVCTYAPKAHPQDEPGAALMDFVDESYYGEGMGLGVPMMPPLCATGLASRDAQIRKQFEGVGTHVPDVFTLPKDHAIAPQVLLQPRADIPFLWGKFQQSVAAVMMVPYDMVQSSGPTPETIRKTAASGRIFTSNMTQVCQHLQRLLTQAYEVIYKGGKGAVRFRLSPLRRLEVESIADLKVLFEIGALTALHGSDVSSLVIEAVGRRKEAKVRRTGPAGNEPVVAPAAPAKAPAAPQGAP